MGTGGKGIDVEIGAGFRPSGLVVEGGVDVERGGYRFAGLGFDDGEEPGFILTLVETDKHFILGDRDGFRFVMPGFDF